MESTRAGGITMDGQRYPIMDVDPSNGTMDLIDYTMRNTENDVRARFIGMMHVANTSFYDEVEEQLSNGATRLLEGVQKATPEELADKDVQEFTASMRNMMRMMRGMGDNSSYDVAFQGKWQKVLFPEESADISATQQVEILRSKGFPFEVFRKLTSLARKSFVRASDEKRGSTDNLFKMLLQPKAPFIGRLVQSIAMSFAAPRAFVNTVKDVRNRHVVGQVQEYKDGEHLVLPWGAAHLQEMTRLLGADGKWGIETDSIHYRRAFDMSKKKKKATDVVT